MGKGNFAMVYEVEKISNNKHYAVKVFNKKVFLKDESDSRSLLNEIKIMRRMNHARILKLKEIYEGENHIYIVMKLCNGQNLLNHLINNGY